MKTDFLHIIPKYLQLKRIDLIVGILTGSLFSFSFYSFLYMCRETLRIFSLTEQNDLWVLSENETDFYNLFLAFVAVLTAQSLVFVFWLDRPKKLFLKRNYIKITILTDQRLMTWFFLSWFSKVALLYGFFYGDVFKGGFYVFSFYPDYIYLFIFFIIPLFFHQWITLRKVIKRHSLKWMLLSAVLISALSFGLSKINLIDHQSINQKYLDKNIYFKYDLDLPESEEHETVSLRSRTERIYFVNTKNSKGISPPITVIDSEEIPTDSLSIKIAEMNTRHPADLKSRMTFLLYIDQEIQMKTVNQLKEKLSHLGISNIGFAVVPTNRSYDKRYYQDHFIRMVLPGEIPGIMPPTTYKEIYTTDKNIIKIKAESSGQYSINDQPVESTKLKTKLKALILETPNYSIQLDINEHLNYSTYIHVLSNIIGAVNELMDEYSMEHYEMHYSDDLEREKIQVIKRKYPLKIFENYE